MARDTLGSDRYCDPARTVIRKLGGVEAAAEAAEVHVTRVRRWMTPRRRDPQGCDGIIPARHHQVLLDWAAAHGRPLAPADFFAACAAAE